jgi:glutaminase
MATSGRSIAASAGESLPSAGKGGLGTFAPPLDNAGNSVKGELVAKFLSQRLGMDLFVSNSEA